MAELNKKTLDLARCLNDAMDLYRRNFLTLLLAAILFDLLSLFSLFILAGPLWGGIAIMTLRGMTDRQRPLSLGDLFSAFHHFGGLVAIFFITAVCIVAGLFALILPGVLLAALWLFPSYLMVDQNLGVMDSLKTSWRIVRRRGIWINAAAAFVIIIIMAGPAILPDLASFLISWLLSPIAWGINTSAYIQEVREQYDEADFPHGFPVVPAATVAPPQA